MPLTLIIWFMLLISGCVQQQQPHEEMQLPIDYHVHPYGAALDGQESTSYSLTDNNITFLIALATSASEQHNSSASSIRATTAEFTTNGGSSTAAAMLLSSTDDYNGTSTTNRLTTAGTDVNTTDISEINWLTVNAVRGTNNGSSTAIATLHSSTDDYDGATTANRLTKTETEANATYLLTASTELGTDSGSLTATATLSSSTDGFAGASSTSRLTKTETDIGASSVSTVSAELKTTNYGSSSTPRGLSSADDYAGASTTTWVTKNETGVGASSQSTAGIAELCTNTSISSSDTATMMSSTENYSVARDAEGDPKIQVDKDPAGTADRSLAWGLATFVLAFVAINLLVAIVSFLIFKKERRYVLRRNATTRLPGDIEMSAMPSLRLPSSEQNRNGFLSSSQQSELRPSSEVIVL